MSIFKRKKKVEEESEEEEEFTEEITLKFREGACENCGANTHTKRDCVERPRKVGAKYSSKNLKADEKVKKRRQGFNAKRDNWEYYNPDNHTELVKEHELEKKIKKELNIDKGNQEYMEKQDDNTHYLDKDDDTRDKNYHSLRQREDIPAYLRKEEKEDQRVARIAER